MAPLQMPKTDIQALPMRLGTAFRMAALVLLAALQSGCAAIAIQAGTEAVFGAALPRTPQSSGPAAQVFPYPVAQVLSALRQAVARNGFELQEIDTEAHTLKVAYPFSLLSNNWGGTLSIGLTPEGEGTRVTIVGDGRDANSRIHKLAKVVFDDLDQLLATAHP